MDAKVHHRVNNSPPLVSVLSQMTPVHTLPLQFLNIHFVLSRALIGLGSGLFSLSFPFKTYFSSFLLATYPAHLPHHWFGYRNNIWARIQIIKLSYAFRFIQT